ncbi:hypothetical protein C8Q80DRAFT_1147175 [Daedaleopsis nitida]|nr:hypothetical protein C8Q80DRAFT_1147175 [Daedaleopsis nitida]
MEVLAGRPASFWYAAVSPPSVAWCTFYLATGHTDLPFTHTLVRTWTRDVSSSTFLPSSPMVYVCLLDGLRTAWQTHEAALDYVVLMFRPLRGLTCR